MPPGIPHHKVVIQSLYSRRADFSKVLGHGYTLAQARSDVLFSLLFGGQVCASAGAFFDSPFALRIFGELCSHPKFEGYCREYGWRPLWLNTDLRPEPADGSDSPSPVDFITARWLNKKMSFQFFRESEPGFDDPEQMRHLKEAVCAALRCKRYGSMTDLIEPLLHDHRIGRFDPTAVQAIIALGATGDTSAMSPAGTLDSAVLPPILTQETGKWFEGLINYLTTYKAFEHRDMTPRPGSLEEFFPLTAVIERTKTIDGSGSGKYSQHELQRLNAEFLERFGNPTAMNPIHNSGLEHYGPVYYPLIEYWMDTEWHAVRHRMYGASSCVYSSDWQMRDLFDFDLTTRATYLHDVRIDDSLRVTQEGFGEFGWDVLFATISDSKWRQLLRELRVQESPERRREHSDAILNLLAARMTDFQFDDQNGVVTIALKRVASLSYLASYTGFITVHHNTMEGLLGTNLTRVLEVVALPVGQVASSSKPVVNAVQPLLKGAKYLYKSYKGRQLRRAVVPDIYTRCS